MEWVSGSAAGEQPGPGREGAGRSWGRSAGQLGEEGPEFGQHEQAGVGVWVVEVELDAAVVAALEVVGGERGDAGDGLRVEEHEAGGDPVGDGGAGVRRAAGSVPGPNGRRRC